MLYLSRRAGRCLLVMNLMAVACSEVSGQVLDDLTIRYSMMVITASTLHVDTFEPHLYRHNVAVVFGRGPATLGLLFQATDRGRVPDGVDFFYSKPEQGLGASV